jgi:hypothetical protein
MRHRETDRLARDEPTFVADFLESLFGWLATHPPISWLGRILSGPVGPSE